MSLLLTPVKKGSFTMFRSKLAASAVAAALSVFSLGLLGSTAHAVTPVASAPSVVHPSTILIGHRVVNGHGKRVWVYNKRYGPRYRYHRAGYGYYYGGWWYARPWWVVGPAWAPGYGYWGPGPGISLCIGC
jgi:hypothetical protein